MKHTSETAGFLPVFATILIAQLVGGFLCAEVSAAVFEIESGSQTNSAGMLLVVGPPQGGAGLQASDHGVPTASTGGFITLPDDPATRATAHASAGATATSASYAMTASSFSTGPKANAHADGSAYVAINVSGITPGHGLTYIWAMTGTLGNAAPGTPASTGAISVNGAGVVTASGTNSINVSGTTARVEIQITASANVVANGLGEKSSFSKGEFRIKEEEASFPGSDEAHPDQLLASGVDISDLRSIDDGDPDDEKVKIAIPVPVAGTYLTPVVDTHARTSPLFLTSPAGGGGGLSVQSAISVTAYRYKVSDNLFTHFTLPSTLPGGENGLQIEVGGNTVPYTPGTLFDLTQYVPGGVSEFFLSGINPEERLVLPPLSGLQFASNGIADIRIAPADIAVFADFNSDGVADAGDYAGWRKQGGTVGQYNAWRRDFGTTIGGGGLSQSLGGASVPEPSSLLQGAIAVMFLIRRNSRR